MRRPLHWLGPRWIAAALLFLPAAAFAAESDREFAEKATHGNNLEVELGQLAVERAENAEVKTFGQQLMEDHSQAQEELRMAAEEMGIELPDGLDAKGEETKQKLSELEGAEFDRAYLEEMVSDHKKEVEAYEQVAEGPDTPVQRYALETLEVLRAHRELAEQLHKEVQ